MDANAMSCQVCDGFGERRGGVVCRECLGSGVVTLCVSPGPVERLLDLEREWAAGLVESLLGSEQAARVARVIRDGRRS